MRNHFRWHQVKTQVLVCKSLISNKECPCHPAFNFKYKILNSSLGIERPIFTFVNVAQPCSRLRNVVEFGNKFQLLPLWESWSWQKSKRRKIFKKYCFWKSFSWNGKRFRKMNWNTLQIIITIWIWRSVNTYAEIFRIW